METTLEDYKRVAADGLGSLVEVTTNAYLDIAMPLLATIFVVAALGGFLQIGFTLNPKRIQIRWEKLNPISGMKRLVSLRSVFTVGLSMLKMLVVGSIVYVTLKDLIPRARNIGDSGIDSIVARFTETVFTIGLRVAAVLLFLGLLDLMWQRWRHGKDLMMTKEDVKEERKRGEGDPRVKGRIRQIQREVARARMMHDVKNASVVIRNPVHYAVALKYEPGQDHAPKVLAKGRNLIALRIIDLVGFDDTEGVVHIEGNTFAVTEERRFLLTTFELDDAATEVQHGEAKKVPVDEIYGAIERDAAGLRLVFVARR